MANNMVYPQAMSYMGDKIRNLHKNVESIMIKLGGKTVNSSYILLDGRVKEAYGYYRFPKVGAVMTSLSYSEDLRCIFNVNFLGFENDRNKFKKIKTHIEEALKRNGLNSVPKK